ncbi:hypothetical protein ALC62_07255 [Cyphomyrmex costatus]|uniref:Uncharacterized protein n=1 Tax=Cyphomyrmex costatus TaxID=456900 RepID=A0A195CNA1_9HYME|nr:hypothetical protein ALC62_07255 [Cyphomyrmex costatus]
MAWRGAEAPSWPTWYPMDRGGAADRPAAQAYIHIHNSRACNSPPPILKAVILHTRVRDTQNG